jgi:hypothetical protein
MGVLDRQKRWGSLCRRVRACLMISSPNSAMRVSYQSHHPRIVFIAGKSMMASRCDKSKQSMKQSSCVGAVVELGFITLAMTVSLQSFNHHRHTIYADPRSNGAKHR